MTLDRYFGVKILVLSTLLLLIVHEFIMSNSATSQQTTTSRGVNTPEFYSQTIKNSILFNVTVEERTKFPGLVWPKEVMETNDRISDQLQLTNYLKLFGKVNAKKLKIIYLVPHINYGDPPPEGQHLFTSEQCPVQACSITMKLEDVKNADAVYLQSFQPSMLKQLLPKPKNQVWIVTGRESPPLTRHMKLFDSHALRNLVNWTMFYRRDATISTPYGKFQTFPNFTRIEDYRLADGVNYAAGKTKKVAWFFSNCNFGTNSGRENYAKELAKYIDIDIYGLCGKLKCPKEEMGGCFQILKRDYKFYLAFENNCCKDYITEKFFNNALLNDVIPIVLGAHPDDYKALAPPGSYIHVEDFESPKELAEYLHLLDKNDTLYNEYFRWKKTGTFLAVSPWCRLCALLHANDDRSYVHWYPDFYKWWEKGICLAKPKRGQWQSWRNRMRS